MYGILFTSNAEKQIKKLDVSIQKRVISTLERSRIRPQAHFVRLVGSKAYKLRVGDYRVIADIVENLLIIHIIEIGHRRSIYKK